MSFILYDIIFLVIFTLAVVLFLYKRRANLQRQGLLYLYRTKFGLKIIESTSKKFAPILKPLQYLIIACGYILMILMLWLLIQFTYIYTTSTLFVKATKIPPIVPLVPYLPEIFNVDFLPPFYFTYWIVIIAIIAISHEFAHGIFARLNKIRVKSTGFGFLGPFLAAFVEPDEKQMNKSKKFPQLAILAAGTFANVVMTILFGLIFWLFFISSFTPAGVNFNTYATTAINLSEINEVNGNSISSTSQIPLFVNESLAEIKINENSYFVSGITLKAAAENKLSQLIVYEDAPAIRAKLKSPIVAINNVKVTNLSELREQIRSHDIGDEVTITTIEKGKKVDNVIVLAEKDGNPYLGIGILAPQRKGISGFVYTFITKIKDPFVYYEPMWDGDFVWFIYHLLWWTVLINLSVALVNMLPVGIFDGGRFFYLTILGLTGKEKIAKNAFALATWIILLIFVWLTLRWFIAYF